MVSARRIAGSFTVSSTDVSSLHVEVMSRATKVAPVGAAADKLNACIVDVQWLIASFIVVRYGGCCTLADGWKEQTKEKFE